MLRQADTSDRELVLKLCLKFTSQIAMKDFAEEATISKLVDSFLTDEDKAIFLYGEVGMLAACVVPFLLGTVPTAHEVAWWVEPEHRGYTVGKELVKAYETWAKSRGCRIISMACYSNNSLGPFYEKCGYSLHELGYVKCLPAY